MFVTRRVQPKTRSPPPASIASEPIHIACRNKACFVGCLFKRNLKLVFTLRSVSRAAQMAIALNRTCGLEPLSVSSRPRARLSPVSLRGRHRCVDRKVVVPKGYSKRFFAAQSGFYGGIFRAETARG